MVITLIFTPNHGILQISLHVTLSLLTLGYTIVVRPYQSDVQNLQEILNELFTLITAYLMLLFTDFISDEEEVGGKNLKF